MIVISLHTIAMALFAFAFGRCVIAPALEAWTKNMSNPHLYKNRRKAPVKPVKPVKPVVSSATLAECQACGPYVGPTPYVKCAIGFLIFLSVLVAAFISR
jgi:hypothetical protein